MGTKHQKWFKFEEDIQSLFGLEAMPGSGNQWHSPSDGATPNTDPTPWPLMVDCKHTVQRSYSLTRKLLDQWVHTAMVSGRHFALPVRFENPDDTTATRSDYVVIPTEDYADLVDFYRHPRNTPPLAKGDTDFLRKLAAAIGNSDVRRQLTDITQILEGK